MSDDDKNSFTIVFNTASEAEYIEVMRLGLHDAFPGYFSDNPNADLYDLFDVVNGLVDDDHPRFAVRTSRIEDVKALLPKKTTIPFDVFPGLVFKN